MNIAQFFFKTPPTSRNSDIEALFTFLYGLIKRQDLVDDIWNTYKEIPVLSEEEQMRAYVRTYRQLEQFIITNVPPIVTQEFTKQTLRGSMSHILDINKLPPYLQLFFVSPTTEHILLFQVVTKPLITNLLQNFGTGKLNTIVKHITENTTVITIKVTEQGFEFPSPASLSTINSNDLDRILQILYAAVYNELKSSLGSAIVLNMIRKSFDFFKDVYDAEILRIFFRFVPEDLLQEDRLSFFTKEELSQQVSERTQELNKKIKELERVNEIMVGRELRMAEIKKENELLKQQIQALTKN